MCVCLILSVLVCTLKLCSIFLHHILDNQLDRTSKLLAAASESLIESWGGDGEQERILQGLKKITELDEAFMFREPVDVEEVPTYCKVVAFPTDLSTIRERLSNGFYR